MTEHFDFSKALRLMKNGKKVSSEFLKSTGINWYKLDDTGYYILVSDDKNDFVYSIPSLCIEEMLLKDWYEVSDNENTTMSPLTEKEKEKLSEHLEAICDLLKKHYKCITCPFNEKNQKIETAEDFECELDALIENI